MVSAYILKLTTVLTLLFFIAFSLAHGATANKKVPRHDSTRPSFSFHTTRNEITEKISLKTKEGTWYERVLNWHAKIISSFPRIILKYDEHNSKPQT